MLLMKMSTLKEWGRTFLPLGLLPILVACGEPDSSNSSALWPENQVDQYVSVQAEDFYSVVQSNESEEVKVNVVDKVASSGGERLSIAEIEVLSSDPSCRLVDNDSESFKIVTDRAMVCDYQYTVELAGYPSGYQIIGKRSGVSRVVVANNAQQAELIPFGVSSYQDETFVINIESELVKVGDNTSLSGYSLTDDVILMPTGSSSTITLDKTKNEISYKPAATFKGNERILYTLKNNSGNVLVGSVVVTVSERSTIGIELPSKIEITDTILVGKTSVIDISPYIIDKQDDNFQLIQVVAFNSTVALENAVDVKNKTFTFKADYPGQFFVNAVVTDHRGGFDTALLKIEVTDPTQVGLWDDYYYDNKIYSAPLTKVEADVDNIRTDGVFFDSTHSRKPAVALFRPNNASQYCGSFGRLPTKNELQGVWVSDKGNDKLWPLSRGYLTLDGSSYKVISLSSGQELTDDGQGYYVTCVSNGALSIKVINGTAVANDEDTAIVEATFLINEKAVAGITVNASVSGSARLIKDSQVTDGEGKVRFEVSSTKAELVKISVNVNGEFSVSQQVTFIPDLSTAVLKQFLVTQNDSLADGKEQNQVTALVEDKFSNVVSGVTINFVTSSSTATLERSSAVTDVDGKATVNITNVVEESIEIKATYKTVTLSTNVRFVNDYSYGFLTVKALTDSTVADGNSKIAIEAEFKQNGRPSKGAKITGVVTGEAKFENDVLSTGDDGKVIFYLTSTKAENVTVNLTVGTFSKSVDVSFYGDVGTAKISLEVVINNSYKNQVNALLKDANDNVLKEQTITYALSSSETASISHSTKTNNMGISSVFITNSTEQFVTLTASYGNAIGQSVVLTFGRFLVIDDNNLEIKLVEWLNTTHCPLGLVKKVINLNHYLKHETVLDIPDSMDTIARPCSKRNKNNLRFGEFGGYNKVVLYDDDVLGHFYNNQIYCLKIGQGRIKLSKQGDDSESIDLIVNCND